MTASPTFRPIRPAGLLAVALLLGSPAAFAQGTKADYERADNLYQRTRDTVAHEGLTPRWLGEGSAFWYRDDGLDGARTFYLVEPETAERRPAFDHARAAELLGKATDDAPAADRLPFDRIALDDDGAVRFEAGGKTYRFAPDADALEEGDPLPAEPNRREGRRGPRRPFSARFRPENMSPDGKLVALIRDHNLYIRPADSDDAEPLTTDGNDDDRYDPRFWWSPDSTHLVVTKTRPAQEHKVHMVDSAPDDQLQPKLVTIDYLKPGDRIDDTKPHLFDLVHRREIPVSDRLFPNPWSIQEIAWDADSSRFTFLYNQRGHQALRLIAVDADTGDATAIIDEQSPTFIDYNHKTYRHDVEGSDEIIWMSERHGWNHLYLIDSKTGAVKNAITRGDWVVREVTKVDDEARQVWFRAGGIRPGQDPYYLHEARVNFDGTGLVVLTEGDGTHRVEFSPDRKYLVDTYSRVDLPPVVSLRRADDGTHVMELQRADWSKLLETGWQVPERFVARGRDGQTDIYGVIFRPTDFDPSKRYPVIEQIYAGPQGAFVPKGFSAFHYPQAMAELGFILVQIDGMGTNWRSKAFHDVCYKDLADSGFPDRIAWLKAAAAEHPELDLDRVGLYGGSAGGQSALGGLLFHPEFYKAGAADCGCHDNRMDKVWWNELWMGWPVDDSYAASSNVVNAHKLQGKLLLTVGELDHNVDPASTMQVVDALIKADKDFELIVFPGADHGAGGSPYGRRRRNDFFVRNLLGVEPRSR